MVLPNFLIIGAAKAGTTSLYHCLKQHPQIYMSPVKEPRFFALEGESLHPDDVIHRQSITDLTDYLKLFQAVSAETAVGEVSPIYLTHAEAAVRIQHYIPRVKLIAILRNPLERAYSHFTHMRQTGVEPLSDFMKALREEEYRIGNFVRKRPYIPAGFYYVQLKRYLEIFDPQQVKVYLYEDWKQQPYQLLENLFQFLDVDVSFMPSLSKQYNAYGTPKSQLIHQLTTKQNLLRSIAKALIPVDQREPLMRIIQRKNSIRTEMPDEAKNYLCQVYSADTLKLQDLIGRDLSGWLQLADG
ncbi:MAG: sulfotransferase domain-containing protein [Elainella sp. Prado103]|jgi:hypothetical protein|nr:sulfotransferase domain-containing protein [Elainella sp. Prado103]